MLKLKQTKETKTKTSTSTSAATYIIVPHAPEVEVVRTLHAA